MKPAFTLLAALALSLVHAQAPLAPDPAAQKQLDALQKAYDAAKKAYTAKPKDKKVEKKFVDAAVRYGHESMVSTALSPRIKYRQALRLYREVLKLDPANKVAKPEYDLIVGIYKQMGRPVPKD